MPVFERSSFLSSRVLRRAVIAMLFMGILLVGSAPASATSTHTVDPREFATFFDDLVPDSLDTFHIPGATVAVVSDGELVFAEGYGMSDLENQVAFDPERSMVRIASISKLFTWTAVMQLVESGQLDLDADVNTYLKSFQVPETFPDPITLNHLMTHTAGFEERAIGIGARAKEDVPPLGDYLAAHMPARVHPPGEISAYSNYGAALAGYIVSVVSGLPYEQYVQERILDPLDMAHSTAWEPVPEPMRHDLARSYEFANGSNRVTPFVFDKLVPDGSISASAIDMAHFMLAHLQDGRYGDQRILQDETARLMHEESYAPDPLLAGWAHGFRERTFNGHRVILHDGSWESFQSIMLLVPDSGLGLFISYNGTGGIEAGTELLPLFFDRFLPGDEPTLPESTDGSRPDQEIAGFYRPARSSGSTIEKVLTLVDSYRARVADDGTLTFNGGTWAPISSTLFQKTDGSDRLAILRGPDGAVRYVATNGPSYERLAWFETSQFNFLVLLVFVLIGVSAVVGIPAAAGIRRRRKQPAPSKSWRQARIWATVGCAIGLLFTVLFGMVLLGDTSEFLYGVPGKMWPLMALPVVLVAFTVLATVATVRSWNVAGVRWPGRIHQTLVLCGMVAMLWFCQQWNLIGWHFG